MSGFPTSGEAAAWPILLSVVGLAVGSFLGLLSLRLPTDEPVVAGRSGCRACGRTLGPLELLPLLSFALQRGRCRGCGARIPRRYPALEAGCALLGLWAGLAHPGAPGLVAAALGWSLLLIAVIDAEHFWLPDRLTLPLAGTGLAAAAWAGEGAFTARVVGAVAGFAALVLIGVVYRRVRGREGLGGGDARLLAASGAWVGWMGLPSVLLWASAAGFSVVAARLATGSSVRGDDRLPFGTFLALGTWLTWLYGPIGR